MEVSAIKSFTLPTSADAIRLSATAVKRPPANLNDRKTVGQFVGNVFYGTLLKQVQATKLKGSLMHGGRGEEVFGGQLAMEFAKRIGQSPNDPVAERLYHSIAKRAGKMPGAQKVKTEAVRS